MWYLRRFKERYVCCWILSIILTSKQQNQFIWDCLQWSGHLGVLSAHKPSAPSFFECVIEYFFKLYQWKYYHRFLAPWAPLISGISMVINGSLSSCCWQRKIYYFCNCGSRQDANCQPKWVQAGAGYSTPQTKFYPLKYLFC